MGHHLPGMIRAYGDRALFNRFRTRFIVAPLALLVICIWSSLYNVQAVQLVAMAWGIWHGMMQTYGFGRIYDAKASAAAAGRARSDLMLCFAWFLAAVLLSPMRFRTLLDLYYESGGPVVPSPSSRCFARGCARSRVGDDSIPMAAMERLAARDWVKSGENRAPGQQHRLLVVLQQRRSEHSGGNRPLRGLS